MIRVIAELRIFYDLRTRQFFFVEQTAKIFGKRELTKIICVRVAKFFHVVGVPQFVFELNGIFLRHCVNFQKFCKIIAQIFTKGKTQLMKESVEKFIEFRYKKIARLKEPDNRGEVWPAQCRQSGEFVILKRVRLTGLPYAEMQNFSFKLPAKIIYCAEDESETLIVEEFIQGEILSDRLARKKFLSESEAREILLQMCDGLRELHARKIIHRDIKPSNLILRDGRIRLIDFDAARIFKPDKIADTELLGTKGYAPPEQYGGGQTDERSDIYSFGVTIKVLLGDDYNGRLKKILDVCTEFDPKNRFRSVDELRRAILLKRYSDKVKLAGIFVAFVAAIFPVPAQIDSGIQSLRIVDGKILAHDDEFNFSLGKLKLGDSVEIMRDIYGHEKNITPADTPNHRHCKYEKILVTLAGNSVVGLVSYAEEIQTERGLHQGATLDEMIAAYGRRAAVYEDNELTLHEYPFVSAQGNLAVMRFAVKNNTVDYISLRLANEEREHILADVKDF